MAIGITADLSEESSFVNAVSAVVGAGAFVVYAIIEIAKWIFNHLKDFVYYVGKDLWQYAQAGFSQIKKLSLFLGEALVKITLVICQIFHAALKNVGFLLSSAFYQFKGGIKETIQVVCEVSGTLSSLSALLIQESLQYVNAGSYQSGSLAIDVPSALQEMYEIPRELAAALYENLTLYCESTSLNAKKGLVDGLYGVHEAGAAFWLLIKDEIFVSLELLVSGSRQILSFFKEIPGSLDEATSGIRELLYAVIFNLLEYVASGRHQLATLMDNGVCVFSSILLSSKEAIVIIVKELVLYLSVGFIETKKGAQSGAEIAVEAFLLVESFIEVFLHDFAILLKSFGYESLKGINSTGETAADLAGLAQNGAALVKLSTDVLSDAAVEESKKCALSSASFAAEILTEATELILEFGTLVKQSSLEIFGAGLDQSGKLVVSGVEAIFETVPFDVLYAILETSLAYLVSGASQANRFLIEMTYGSIEGFLTTKEIITIVSKEVWTILGGAPLREGSKLTMEGATLTIQGTLISFEVVKAVCKNLWEYFQSGYTQSLILALFLKQDVPEKAIAGYTHSKGFVTRCSKEIGTIGKASLYESSKLSAEGITVFVEVTQVLFEMAGTVSINVWEYLQSGYTQSLVLGLFFKEDLPDTFRYLVQDPLERFISPKYQWVKKKVLELRRRSQARMERMKANASKKFEKIREATQRRLEEIRRKFAV